MALTSPPVLVVAAAPASGAGPGPGIPPVRLASVPPRHRRTRKGRQLAGLWFVSSSCRRSCRCSQQLPWFWEGTFTGPDDGLATSVGAAPWSLGFVDREDGNLAFTLTGTEISAVPLPMSVWLGSVGIGCLVVFRRRIVASL